MTLRSARDRELRRGANPEWFGAKSDAELIGAVITTHTNTTIQISGRNFSASDVGKLISIVGAGAAGASYIGTIVAGSGTSYTVTPATSASLSNKRGVIGTDNTAAFNRLIAFRNGAQGGLIRLGDCDYAILGPLDSLTPGTHVKGNGQSSTLYYFGTARALKMSAVGVAYGGANKLSDFSIVACNTVSLGAVDVNEQYDVTLDHLYIYGDPSKEDTYPPGFTDAGIRITSTLTDAGRNSAHISTRGTLVHGCAGDGIQLYTAVLNAAACAIVNINDSRIQGNHGWGIHGPSNGNHEVNIHSSDVEGNELGSIKFEQFSALNITGNCHIEISSDTGIELGKTLKECAAPVIIGNTFSLHTNASTNRQYGIVILGGTGVSSPIIKGNRVTSDSTYASSFIRITGAGVSSGDFGPNTIDGTWSPDTGTIPTATSHLEDYSGVSTYRNYEGGVEHVALAAASVTRANEAAGTLIGQIKRWTGSAWVLVGVAAGALGNADATKTVADGNLLIMPPATMTTDRTVRLGASGATASESIAVERYDLTAHTLTIVDDASSATLYTFPVSVSRAAVFSFDGTNFSLVNNVAINAQVV